MAQKEKRLCSTSEIAEILGLSDRRIRQLEQEGAITKVGRGKYDLVVSVQRYIEWIKKQAASADGDEVMLKRERTLLVKTNRERAELELRILRGELHRAKDIEAVMNHMLGSFRARCLGIPTKLAPKLLGQKDLSVVKEAIKSEIYEALVELSNYDPEMFYAENSDNKARNEKND